MIIGKTDRLIIRESSGSDFSRIYSMMLSVSPDETTDTVSPDENEELGKYLAYIHTAYSLFGFGLWSVCLKEKECGPAGIRETGCRHGIMAGSGNYGEVIGRCGLQAIADENTPLSRIELGYLIDPAYRRRGYGYEACSGIITYAFDVLEIDGLYANISSGNTASERLAVKLGFKKMENGLWMLKNPAEA